MVLHSKLLLWTFLYLLKPRLVAVLAVACGSLCVPLYCCGQPPNPIQHRTSQASSAGPDQSRIFRDPVSGRTYVSEIRDIKVPVRTWEPTTVKQTYYQPRWVTKMIPHSQVVYRPHQSYQLTTRYTNWWNPFRSASIAYSYAPVTQWVPTLQTQQRAITYQQWTPQERTIVAQQPVVREQTQQQIVTTEVPANTAIGNVSPAASNRSLMAWQRQPRLNFSLRTPHNFVNSGVMPASDMLAQTVGRSPSKLRPIPSQLGSGSIPSRIASQNNGRDSIQLGMQPTVLR